MKKIKTSEILFGSTSQCDLKPDLLGICLCFGGEGCQGSTPENLLLGLVHQKLCMTMCPVKHLDSDKMVDFRTMGTGVDIKGNSVMSQPQISTFPA